MPRIITFDALIEQGINVNFNPQHHSEYFNIEGLVEALKTWFHLKTEIEKIQHPSSEMGDLMIFAKDNIRNFLCEHNGLNGTDDSIILGCCNAFGSATIHLIVLLTTDYAPLIFPEPYIISKCEFRNCDTCNNTHDIYYRMGDIHPSFYLTKEFRINYYFLKYPDLTPTFPPLKVL